MGDAVQGFAAGQETHRLGCQYRGEDQWAKGFHGDGADHDLSDEQRSGDGRVVGCGNPRRGAAGEYQPSLRHRPFSGAADQGGEQRRELYHRTFAADGAARGHGKGRRKNFHDAGAQRQTALAEDHRLHEIGGTVPPRMPASAEVEHRAGDQAAGDRCHQALPGRQLGKDLHDAAVLAAGGKRHQVEQLAKQHRRQAAQNADQTGPEQHLVAVHRLIGGRQADSQDEEFPDPRRGPPALQPCAQFRVGKRGHASVSFVKRKR